MTVAEIFQQASAPLSVQERKERVKLLIDTLDRPPEPKSDEPETHFHSP